MSGKCLEGVWGVSVKCKKSMGGVWKVSRKSLEII